MRHDLVSTNSNALALDKRLFDLFTEFLGKDVASGDAADDTLKTYRSSLKQFFQWCALKSLSPLGATKFDLKDYRHWLIEIKKYSIASIALKLAVVRRFYACLQENELIVINPTLGLKPPRENRDPALKINYLQSEEMCDFISHLPQGNSVQALRDRLMVGLMVLQGCRTIEIHRSCVGDIIHRGADVGLSVEGKRSKRIVPLTPELASLLKRYLDARKQTGERLKGDTPLFISVAQGSRGERLSRRSIERVVDKYLIASGLKKAPPLKETGEKKDKKTKKVITKESKKSPQVADNFDIECLYCESSVVEESLNGENSVDKSTEKLSVRSFNAKVRRTPRQLSAHSLRHTAGTLTLRAGASLRQVQDLLGHADPRTTAIYAHISDRWEKNPALLLNYAGF